LLSSWKELAGLRMARPSEQLEVIGTAFTSMINRAIRHGDTEDLESDLKSTIAGLTLEELTSDFCHNGGLALLLATASRVPTDNFVLRRSLFRRIADLARSDGLKMEERKLLTGYLRRSPDPLDRHTSEQILASTLQSEWKRTGMAYTRVERSPGGTLKPDLGSVIRVPHKDGHLILDQTRREVIQDILVASSDEDARDLHMSILRRYADEVVMGLDPRDSGASSLLLHPELSSLLNEAMVDELLQELEGGAARSRVDLAASIADINARFPLASRHLATLDRFLLSQIPQEEDLRLAQRFAPTERPRMINAVVSDVDEIVAILNRVLKEEMQNTNRNSAAKKILGLIRISSDFQTQVELTKILSKLVGIDDWTVLRNILKLPTCIGEARSNLRQAVIDLWGNESGNNDGRAFWDVAKARWSKGSG
jgi:hypothetical protein